MIHIKPILYNINAFDSNEDKTITFMWTGNQAFKNICTIRNNATNAIVYQKTQDTIQLKHDIPAGSLSNGVLYNITIKVIDKDNNVSEESTPLLFYCYTTPIFKIDNIIENQVVRNSSYQVTLTYSQSEGEELQYYQFHLYNMNKNEIWSSGVKYDTTTLSAILTDLDDNGTYYIRATGVTINGMELDTGFIAFSVNYVMPSMYAIVTLENKAHEGMIKIQSNIISLEGKFIGGDDNPTYINDEFIDLTNPENLVVFDEGFQLNDFTINIKGYNFADYSTILELSNGQRVITLKKQKGIFKSENNIEKVYFELKVPNAFSHYIIHSNYLIPPKSSDILSIWIRRVNHIYDVYVENLSF